MYNLRNHLYSKWWFEYSIHPYHDGTQLYRSGVPHFAMVFDRETETEIILWE